MWVLRWLVKKRGLYRFGMGSSWIAARAVHIMMQKLNMDPNAEALG